MLQSAFSFVINAFAERDDRVNIKQIVKREGGGGRGRNEIPTGK